MQFNVHEQLPGVERNMVQVPVANGTDMWIYTPEGAEGPLPYIFYVHGGGFVAGKYDFRGLFFFFFLQPTRMMLTVSIFTAFPSTTPLQRISSCALAML